jgi:hypothetical protein
MGDNIKMDLKEIKHYGADWILNWLGIRSSCGLVNTVMNLWVPLNVGNFLTS